MKLTKLFLIIILTFSIRSVSWCQTTCECNTPAASDIGNLRNQISKSKPDTAQLRILHTLGNYYLNSNHIEHNADLDSALFFFQKALFFSEQLHVNTGCGRITSLTMIGETYFAENSEVSIEKGKESFNEILKYYQANGDKQGEAGALSDFGLALRDLNAPQQLIYFKMALEIYHKFNNTEKEVITRYYIAQVYHSESQDSLAENELLRLIDQYGSTNFKVLDRVYWLLARINRYRGNLNKSLAYSLKSIELMQKTKDELRAEKFYGELGEIYQELGETEKSIEWYRQTLILREKMQIPREFIFRTEGFIVKGLIKLKRPKEALNEISALEKRYPPADNFIKGIVAQIKAYCYEALGENHMAEKYYLETVRQFSNRDDEIGEIGRYDLGKFYVKQKEYGKADDYLRGALIRSAIVSRKRDIYLLLSQIDSAKGNNIAALNEYKHFKALSDSIFNDTKSKQIAELQIKYETNQKEQDISLLKKDNLLQQEKVAKANNARNLTYAGIVVLVLFSGLLFYGYRIKQRNNVEINEKNRSLNQLITEKEWLLKEIHHRVKNNLQIVMGLLQRQSSYINNDEALAAIQNSESRMHSIALIHQKLYLSENLDLISMPGYINELIDYLKDSADVGTRIHFNKEIDDVYLDVAQAVPLGLILNEAITNAIKYAYPNGESGIIHVFLHQDSTLLNTLVIADLGPGLPSGFNAERIDSMGMNLMKGLSKQLGGIFQLEIENGVKIKIEFKTEKYISFITDSDIIEKSRYV